VKISKFETKQEREDMERDGKRDGGEILWRTVRWFCFIAKGKTTSGGKVNEGEKDQGAEIHSGLRKVSENN
jgi:hypothetical protein